MFIKQRRVSPLLIRCKAVQICSIWTISARSQTNSMSMCRDHQKSKLATLQCTVYLFDDVYTLISDGFDDFLCVFSIVFISVLPGICYLVFFLLYYVYVHTYSYVIVDDLIILQVISLLSFCRDCHELK